MGYEIPDVSRPTEEAVSDEPPVVESALAEGESVGDTIDTKGRPSILYSEYERGMKLPADFEDTNEEYRDQIAEIRKGHKDALISPAEQQIARQIEGMHVNEAIDASRTKLRQALVGIAESTGASPNSLVQMMGGVLVDGVARGIDSKLKGVLIKTLIKSAPGNERASLEMIKNGMKVEDMMFTQELGGDKGWKLTIGADPRGSKVGVMFRMVMP